MRISNNIIFSLCLLFLAACSKDAYYEIDVSPPSDLTLSFSIAPDDSGLVTIYPQATSAAYFELFYGDTADETPEEVLPGRSGKHTYAEGTYTVRAIAYNLKGESIETSQELNVQFTPPSNLIVEVTIDPIITNMITVTPTADNATLFELFFGDIADEEATVIMPGASAVHTYAESGQYTLRVVARSASSQFLEYTEVLDIIKPAAQLSLPIDFENPDVNYVFTEFGGATLSAIDNPDASGENTSAKVGRLFKMAGAEVWAGGLMQLPEPIDLTTNDQFRLKVWSPKMGSPVRFKLENADDNNIFYELDAITTTSNAWEILTYDFSAIDKGQSYSKVIVFMDFGNTGDDSEYFFDDIEQYSLGGGGGLSLPLDFESDNLDYTFTDFGGAYGSKVDNPDQSGINTSAMVGRLFKEAGAETWAGAFLQLDGPIDFDATDQFFVKVWSPKNGIIVKAKVENSADGAIAHEVDMTTTTNNTWEELQFDFSTIDKNQSYDRFVIFFDFGANGDDSEYFFDDVRLTDGGGSSDVLSLPIDFESEEINYAFTDFGNISAERIDNPDASGINTSAKVGHFTKTAGAETWGGTFLQLPDPIDFSSSTTMSMKIWSPKADITVLLKVENATNGGIFHEVPVMTTTTNSWETLTFDMSGIDTGQTYSKVVVFFDFGVNGDGTEYYFDDINLN